MEIIGKIKLINPERQVNENFRTRELIVSTDEQYPQHISVQFFNDKCDLLNVYAVGEEVKVSVNLRGKEWINPQGETKFFNTIQAWRIEKLQAASPPEPEPETHTAFPLPEGDLNEDEFDDLPF